MLKSAYQKLCYEIPSEFNIAKAQPRLNQTQFHSSLGLDNHPRLTIPVKIPVMEVAADLNAMELDENFEEHGQETAVAAGIDAVDRDTQIPLICLLCPKSSKFSDISHLLTHLSSKGHLANKFRLDIAKGADEASSTKLGEFQAWYDQHGIQELLRARNETRTQRQSRMGRAKSSKIISGKTEGVSKAKHSTRGARGNARPASQLEKVKGEDVKENPDEDADCISDITSFSHGQHSYPWEGDFKGFELPLYHSMSGHPQHYQQRSINHLANHPKFRESVGSDDFEAVDEKSQGDEASSIHGDLKLELADGSSTLHSDIAMETGVMRSPELATAEEAHNAKFRKGEWLKGMEVFDSASTEARRRRNQRKDPAILQKMLESSLLVEQTETVTDLNFVLHKERNVYDEPSIDGSEDDVHPGFTKKKKTRGTRVSRGGIGKPRGRPIKIEQNVDRNFEPISSNREGHKSRGPMRGRRAKRASSREESPRSTASVPRLRRSGRIHARGSHQEDVFRDLETPARDLNGDVINHRCDGLPEMGLALRPGNPNVALLSPTPIHKVHSPRLYGGKENSAFVFPHTLTTSNPFLDAHTVPASSSYNPLYVQPRDDTVFNAFQPYDEESKPFTSGFHPINNHASYDHVLHVPSRTGSTGFQQDVRHGAYGI